MGESRGLKTDILIVGQGLAGSLLAFLLQQLGIEFHILDNGWKDASSTAAAGLINPVTGQRLVKTRHLDQLLPAASDTYALLEQLLGIPIQHPRSMLRLIRKPAELKHLDKRLADASYSGLLGKHLSADELDRRLIAPLGAIEQFHTGFIDLPLLLKALRKHFIEAGRFSQIECSVRQIRLHDTGIAIEGIEAKRVVFCEGYRGKDNPWFKQLPFQPAKGEILTLEFDRPLPNQIINAGNWIIPLDGNRYRLGSTYDHDRLDNTPTSEGEQQLINALPDLINSPPKTKLVDHWAGVRPATLGTQPFIGAHPEQPRLHIFNGFGSKGSLSIPWYAQLYAGILAGSGKAALPPEANISRFSHDL
jgi:glycine/D-amino acid oxidase-like deaminating enzyme